MSEPMYACFERRYEAGGRSVAEPREAVAWRVCAGVKSVVTIGGTPDTGSALARVRLDRLLRLAGTTT